MDTNQDFFSEDENKRVQTLFSYQILDNTIPDAELDDITKAVATIYDAPISTIALLDHSKVYVKSMFGTECGIFPKNISFCQYTIRQNDILIVEDSYKDDRFKENPYVVNFPFIRFYAAMPLITPSGYVIGTLSVLDKKPRQLNEGQKFVLKALARQVITNFELRKQNKEMIQLNAKSIELSKAKEEFFYNLSHELRTPLNAITGFTEIIGKTKLDKKQREYLNIIKSSLDILISLINDILDYSKIETGNLKIENHPFNIKKLIQATYELLKIKSLEKNIELKVNIPENIPAFINGERVRLNQILMNLIGNAIKFTNKGSVTLNIQILEETDEVVKLRFSIKDTGIGIPTDKLEEIFERFHQVEGTTRSYGGSGLGLSISKSLVELQGGKLEVQSEIGKGSEFNFSILYKKLNEEETKILIENGIEKEFDSTFYLSNIKILLVEDNAINVKLIEKVFEGQDVTLDKAENGKACLEKLQNNRYDLILMDLYMPEMDGYEATRYIRNTMMLDLPIIGLSANLNEIDKNKCLELGMNEYLTKPFNIDELYRAIHALVYNKKYSSSKIKSDTIIKPKKRVRFKIIRRNSNRKKSYPNISPNIKIRERSSRKNIFIKTHNLRKRSSIDFSKFSTTDSVNEINFDEVYLNSPNSLNKLSIKGYGDSINLEKFKEYSGNNVEFEKELIELFLKELPDYLKNLETEINNKNFLEIKKAAHKLKSPLAIFGLSEMVTTFKEIEDLSDKREIIKILNIFCQSKSQLEYVYGEIRTLLSSYSLIKISEL